MATMQQTCRPAPAWFAAPAADVRPCDGALWGVWACAPSRVARVAWARASSRASSKRGSMPSGMTSARRSGANPCNSTSSGSEADGSRTGSGGDGCGCAGAVAVDGEEEEAEVDEVEGGVAA